MKNTSLKFLAIVVIIMSYSCKSTKTIEKTTGAVEISVPFSEGKYKTDKNFFRAKQVGKSMDLATAKKVAIMNAKTELAGTINSTMKSVTDQYTNQRTVGNNQEFENKFEQLARDIVSETLADVRIMDEKILKETDNNYSYWVAIEMSKESVLESMNNRISKDKKLQLDYDKMKFEEVFNSEMEKLRDEQN
tara:strand:+ start:330 stop:902 length:573 start_codon:yes stop_codon:yes gene_type:complete